MRKFTYTGWGFAKKGTKLLRHWGSKSNRHCEGFSPKQSLLKGGKLLRHWGTKGIGHSEGLTEESFLKGAKLLRHYGTKLNLPLPTGEVDFVSERSEFTKSGEGTIVKVINGTKRNCHPEFISGSHLEQMLKQVQHDKTFVHGDNVFVQGNKPCVIARSETTKQSQHGMVMKRCAFTLSEVLIVLAVLGVVAAMTIPDLIQDYREKALITALKKNYSIFEQAVEMAQVDNGFITGWDIGTANNSDGSLKLYNILKPYLRIEKECGTSTGCFADGYESLFNPSPSLPVDRYANAKGVLASGASFHIRTGGTGCVVGKLCGYIGVDVNGKAGPNKAGVDLFYFTIYNWGNNVGVIPEGKAQASGCTYGDTAVGNGLGCTYWVLKHENMDYLRKAGCYVGVCK